MEREALGPGTVTQRDLERYMGINEELGRRLDRTRLPSRSDRNRILLGHAAKSLPADPLEPRRVRRRHPKLLPEGARDRLLEEVHTAGDRMVVTWLADSGFRIGKLCGFHLVDLHLRERAGCGDLRAPHAHVCHREGNGNRARVKVKYPWDHVDGTVCGGLVKPRDDPHPHDVGDGRHLRACVTSHARRVDAGAAGALKSRSEAAAGDVADLSRTVAR
ncbi:hypothetical protein [Actinomadura fibrosa]|uniref:Uncharacterized protein n=1 Tax=Actinomadura fibrosa TaxID=111802 RepID=A0ABW2XMA1_9ACTN|nr:hypothetical protein [Actinomadura fibrosa]